MSKKDNFALKRVLLADDDEDDIILFREAIDEFDHDLELTVAEDGQELMKKLKSEKPDIIFLDLNMPRKNGLECLAEIRSDETYDSTRIVIYSTSSRHKDVEDTRALGANMYFIKPSSYEVLVSKLYEILTLDWEKYSTPVPADFFIFSTDKESL